MKQYSPQEIDIIQTRAGDRVTEIFNALGMEYVQRNDYYQGPCPVHGGDNSRAWYWIQNVKSWRCSTKHCEGLTATGRSSSIFGLVRGVLARRDNKPCSFVKAVNFVAYVLGIKHIAENEKTAEDIAIDQAIAEHRKHKKKELACKSCLADFVPMLVPDTAYYPNRGVSAEIIHRYYISSCDTRGRQFYKRVFFPILDITGQYVAGWSARSIYEECPKCFLHHHPERTTCPDKEHSHIYAKWKHSKDFRAELCLYNSWNARSFVSKTGVAILVEGPGDVWSYEMAGIHNSVAMLGLNISKQQRQMLQKMGALTLIITIDNDEKGLEAKQRLTEQLSQYFRLYFVFPNGAKDLGDMDADMINEQIRPVLEEACRIRLGKDWRQ